MRYPIEKYTFKEYNKKNADGSESKVIMAISTYGGKIVKGLAKCSATDNFILNDGKELAAARCDLKVCLKRQKRARLKREEVAKKLEALTAYYVKMDKYYSDAEKEVAESTLRLAEIEKKLS